MFFLKKRKWTVPEVTQINPIHFSFVLGCNWTTKEFTICHTFSEWKSNTNCNRTADFQLAYKSIVSIIFDGRSTIKRGCLWWNAVLFSRWFSTNTRCNCTIIYRAELSKAFELSRWYIARHQNATVSISAAYTWCSIARLGNDCVILHIAEFHLSMHKYGSFYRNWKRATIERDDENYGLAIVVTLDHMVCSNNDCDDPVDHVDRSFA